MKPGSRRPGTKKPEPQKAMAQEARSRRPDADLAQEARAKRTSQEIIAWRLGVEDRPRKSGLGCQARRKGPEDQGQGA